MNRSVKAATRTYSSYVTVEHLLYALLDDEEVKQIELDPFLETADTDRNNNYWPVKVEPTKFELYQYKNRRDKSGNNPMKKKKK